MLQIESPRGVVAIVTAAVGVFLLATDAIAAHRRTDAESVQFHAVDPFGTPLAVVLTSFRNVRGEELVQLFKGLVGKGVPRGTYSYTLVYPSGARPPLSGKVNVYSPGHWFTVVDDRVLYRTEGGQEVFVDREPVREPARVGRVILNSPLRSPAWVRLQAVFGQASYECAVDREGRFNVSDFVYGRYVALVFEAGQLSFVQEVTVSDVSTKEELLLREPAKRRD